MTSAVDYIVILSRLQFAITTLFHIIWPVLTIGLSLFLVVTESLWLRTGDAAWYMKAMAPSKPRMLPKNPLAILEEFGRPVTTRDIHQIATTEFDGLLRFRSRFFDQCCYLGCVRKKDRVAARKFNDLRLRPLRHVSLP